MDYVHPHQHFTWPQVGVFPHYCSWRSLNITRKRPKKAGLIYQLMVDPCGSAVCWFWLLFRLQCSVFCMYLYLSNFFSTDAMNVWAIVVFGEYLLWGNSWNLKLESTVGEKEKEGREGEEGGKILSEQTKLETERVILEAVSCCPKIMCCCSSLATYTWPVLLMN